LNNEEKTEELTFFEQWSIYQKIIKNNYMFHTEIHNIVRQEIAHINDISILDLGCGDSYVLMNSIGKKQRVNYLGIDTSEMALQSSKKNLGQCTGELKHIKGDLLIELQKLTPSFDVIISGYSLHHLSTKDKQLFFSLVSTILSKNGVLIFYDIESNAGETQTDYNNRACANYQKNWVQLNDNEIKGVVNHIKQNDLPENESFYLKNMQDNGFVNTKKAFTDKNKLFSLYIARK